MLRAAVLIGVSKTGELPMLNAVQDGLAQMASWARDQGIDGDRLVVISDHGGSRAVTAFDIADAVDKLVLRRDLDQLIVYFTGHGIQNRGDFWLLSGAPRRAAEAVNVEGSIQLARYCGISHVVFLSDACRTAADGIQALGITGTEIFPNDPVDGMERPVDAFFACARGKPALEVRDPLQAAGGFSAVYTDVLAECLSGRHAEVLDPAEEGDDVALVSVWKLADRLLAEVPKRLRIRLGKMPSVNQTPVARISSREAWISRVPALPPPPGPGRHRGGPKSGSWKSAGGHSTRPDVGEPNAVDAADQMLSSVLCGEPALIDDEMLGGEHPEGAPDAMLRAVAARLSAPFGPTRHEPGCGLRVRGAQIRALHCKTAAAALLDSRTVARSAPGAGGAAVNVVVEMEDGGGVLLPLIPGLIAELTFDADELAHVAYQPARSGTDDRDPGMNGHREMAAAMAAAAAMGVFRLTDANQARLAQAMAAAHSPDPSIALYASYAYHESGQRDMVREMQQRLQRSLGFTFFDIAMLAGDGMQSTHWNGTVLPAVPMLSRGWSLLKAFRAPVPPALLELQNYLRPSLWTLFNTEGTRRLVAAIQQEG